MKDKLFNHKTDKIMKNIALGSSIMAVFSLLLVSVLFYIMYKYAPGILYS